MKYVLIIAAFLAAGWGITYLGYKNRGETIDTLQSEINRLNGNNKLLEKSLEERNAKQLELAETIERLEKVAKNDPSNFDWYYDISNSSVVLELHKD